MLNHFGVEQSQGGQVHTTQHTTYRYRMEITNDDLEIDVKIPSSSPGVMLDASLFNPSSLAASGSPFALILHPYPLMGGSKDDGVVCLLQHALARAGWRTLRLQSRLHWAEQARKDVLAAVRWLRMPTPTPTQVPVRVALVGYSWGSVICGAAVASCSPLSDAPDHVEDFVAVSYPFSVLWMMWLTSFRSELRARIQEGNHRARVLFLQGDADNFTSVSSFYAAIQDMKHVSTPNPNPSSGSVSVDTVLVPDCSHFWETSAARRQLQRDVVQFLQKQQ